MIGRLKEALLSGDTIRGNALRIYGLQFGSLAVSLLGGVIVARTLGPAQKGQLDLFTLIKGFLQDFGLFGFGSGLLYHFTRKNRSLAETHGTALLFSLAAGGMVALLGVLGLPLWKAVFAGLPSWAILLAFLTAPLAFYVQVWGFLVTGLNRAVLSHRIGMLATFLTVLSILLLWRDKQLSATTLIIQSTIILAINGGICFRWLYAQERKLTGSVPLAKDSLRYGSTVFVGVIANQLHFRLDQLMVSHWLGTAQVGVYALSVRWAEMLFLLDGAIAAAALHKVASASNQESYALTKRLFRAQLYISGGAGLALSVVAYPLLMGLYGEAYRGAIAPLVLLIPGTIAWSVAKLLSGMLTYNSSLASYPTRAAVIGLFVNVLLNGYFVRSRFGINGVAVASSLSYLLVALLIAVKARQVGERAVTDAGIGDAVG